jgi:hypothetical protein
MSGQSVIVIVSVVASIMLAPFGEYLYDLLRARDVFPDKLTIKVLVPLAMACIPLVLLVALPDIVGQGKMSLHDILVAPVPLWLVPVLLVVAYASARSIDVFLRGRPNDSVLFRDPSLVTARSPQSFGSLPSKVIDKATQDSGGISLWAYLHPFEQGIRRLENNRYLIGHGTNGGHIKDFEDRARYPNMLSLRHRPASYNPPRDPIWEVCISNERGYEWALSFPDSQKFEPGWHHFVVRWDHRQPVIELVIDGEMVAQGSDYSPHWPEQRDQAIWIGAWPNKAPIHYVETQLWRAQVVSAWPTDRWMKDEFQRRKPDPPVK